jgi:hypothetical protein
LNGHSTGSSLPQDLRFCHSVLLVSYPVYTILGYFAGMINLKTGGIVAVASSRRSLADFLNVTKMMSKTAYKGVKKKI